MSLRDWTEAALRALEREQAVVRVLLAQVRGSAPREPGVAMLVGSQVVDGTIGGGELEWQALAAARVLLADPQLPARLTRQVLAADLGQCCGGVIELWIERFTRADRPLLQRAGEAARRGPALLRTSLSGQGLTRSLECELGGAADADALLRAPRARAVPQLQRTQQEGIALLERLDDALPALWLYGAGHVGQALARIAAELPLRVTWLDSRAIAPSAPLPEWVRLLQGIDPLECLADAPADAHHLIMTHSHALDYALTRALLLRGEFASAGLIGSASKAARFRSRLAREGVSPARIARLECPIGLTGIASKWPAAIAVGVAARLLQRLSQAQAATAPAARVPESIEPCAAGGCQACGS